jgi:hypothetical protein
MNTTFIKSLEGENTGGNVMIDFIFLTDGKMLAISSDIIGMYESKDSFDNGDEPIQFIER